MYVHYYIYELLKYPETYVLPKHLFFSRIIIIITHVSTTASSKNFKQMDIIKNDSYSLELRCL